MNRPFIHDDFLDQKEGIEWWLTTLSNLGLLRRFVRVVTDSPSFLSFLRRLFSPVLCNLLGRGSIFASCPTNCRL